MDYSVSILLFRLTTFLDYTRTLVYLASFGYTHQENEPSLSTAVTGERNIKSVSFSIPAFISKYSSVGILLAFASRIILQGFLQSVVRADSSSTFAVIQRA